MYEGMHPSDVETEEQEHPSPCTEEGCNGFCDYTPDEEEEEDISDEIEIENIRINHKYGLLP